MSYLPHLVVLCGTTALLGACGTSDAKRKRAPWDDIDSGRADSGTLGSGGNGTGGTATGGRQGTGGSTGGAGGGAGAGAGGAATTGGTTGADSGADSSADSSSGCPAGTDECDGDPATVCETPLTLVTSCGSCTTTCASTNAVVGCENQACAITSCTAGFDSCDGDPANGCETTLASNDEHCGACNRDCAAAGSTCSVDHCAEVLVLSGIPAGTDNGNAYTWAFGQGSVFNASRNSYTVSRIPLDGSPLATVWDSTNATAGRASLVLNGTDVLWAERGTPPVVLRKPISAAGSQLPQVAWTPEFQPQFLQIQGSAYYWATGDYQSSDAAGYIYTRALSAPASDPGTRIVTADQGNHGSIVGFVATTDALYWVTDDATLAIRTTPLSGGTPTEVPGGPIISFPANSEAYLQALGNTLYFVRNVSSSFLNGVYRFTPGDASPTQVISTEDATSLFVDSTTIYYSQGGDVWKTPLTGGAGTRVSDRGGRIVGQDATFLYVIESTSGSSALYKIVK